MLDLGLSKLAIIGVVALVVIGPEKLPGVARVAGTLFGRAQRYLNQVKSEVNREMELDELRKIKEDFQSAALAAQKDITKELENAQREFQSNLGEMTGTYSPRPVPDTGTQDFKRKNFRRKKLARTRAIPQWYRQQQNVRAHVLSGSARVSKYRPKNTPPSTFF